MAYPYSGQSAVTDVVFDEGEDLLLITTSDGDLSEYDPQLGKVVRTISFGGHLGGVAVIGDGTEVLVAQHASVVQPLDANGIEHHTDTIYRLDLETSVYDTLTLGVSSAQTGVLDVAVDASGRAFATTSADTTAPVPLLSFDATSASPTVTSISVPSDQFGDGISPDSYLIPSENQRYILVLDNAGTSVPVDIYDVETAKFIVHRDLGFSYDPATQQLVSVNLSNQADISETAKLTAFLDPGGVVVFDFSLNVVKSLFLR